MGTGRLHAIPNWGTASTSSEESDDLQSLTDEERDNLEDSHYKLNPLWPENISDSLPSELQPFLLSGPVRPQHQKDHKTGRTINRALTPASSAQNHTALSNVGFQPPAGQYYTRTPSHVGHQIASPNVGFQLPAGQHYTWTPSHAGRHIALANDGFQPPAGQQHTWSPSQVGLQHPGGQPVAQMSSCTTFQPLPGPHHNQNPSLRESGTNMVPPSNATCPYATNSGFQPSTQFYPPARASTVPPPNTTSSRHRPYTPDKGKWTKS